MISPLRSHLRPARPRGPRPTRRAVVSVLAMMFLVLFGSLALAMAIVSRGNLRTASTQLHVTRTLGAAETGLAIAKRRLEDAVTRFVIEKGEVDESLGRRLWRGDLSVENWENRAAPPANAAAAAADGRVFVKANNAGFREASRPAGLLDALQTAHNAEANRVRVAGAVTAAQASAVPADAPDGIYSGDSWLVTAPVAVEAASTDGTTATGVYQITYAPLAGGTDIRIFVTAYSDVSTAGSNYLYGRTSAQSSRPLTRTISQDFRIAKRHKHAIVSPSRVMIGKDVLVEGPVGISYTDVQFQNGEPLMLKSDFTGLDPSLDNLLNTFLASVKQYDTDGDNRLRARDPNGESQGLPSGQAVDPDGNSFSPYTDVTGDGFVDDFDLFINFYDARDGQRDGRINLASTTLPDRDLALLLDNALPDRNADGYFGYSDARDLGRASPASSMVDGDDLALGWRDGYIDFRDAYAKVRGSLAFAATKSAWQDNRGLVADDLRGPIVPPESDTPVSPVAFNAADEIPPTDVSSLDSGRSALAAIATGSFAEQVAAQLSGPPPTRWERTPLGAASFFDWYNRPVYTDMTFSNVSIPMGNNGLFINCTFIGVTRIQTTTDNTHPNWSLYGRLNKSGSAYVPQQTILDKSDFPHYADPTIPPPANYAMFEDPPVIGGVIRTGDARDTKLYSNNIRFHNCTFVGSVVSDAPRIFTQVRNKLQFTGATVFAETNPANPTAAFPLNPREGDLSQIRRSSLMVPNFSVDIGGFNAPTDTYNGPSPPTPQEVALKGTIVAGVLDIRGNADIEGSLLTTFKPEFGQLPLFQNGQAVGNPANFNVSLGYFGEVDGDAESIDPATLQVSGGVRLAGWDTDADGLVDVIATPGASAPPGGVAIPFYGYGRVTLRFNPDLPMPDGIRLPLSLIPIQGSYAEGQRHG
jgi:hypothetical protein